MAGWRHGGERAGSGQETELGLVEERPRSARGPLQHLLLLLLHLLLMLHQHQRLPGTLQRHQLPLLLLLLPVEHELLLVELPGLLLQQPVLVQLLLLLRHELLELRSTAALGLVQRDGLNAGLLVALVAEVQRTLPDLTRAQVADLTPPTTRWTARQTVAR